jgi:hypothetical protein
MISNIVRLGGSNKCSYSLLILLLNLVVLYTLDSLTNKQMTRDRFIDHSRLQVNRYFGLVRLVRTLQLCLHK